MDGPFSGEISHTFYSPVGASRPAALHISEMCKRLQHTAEDTTLSPAAVAAAAAAAAAA